MKIKRGKFRFLLGMAVFGFTACQGGLSETEAGPSGAEGHGSRGAAQQLMGVADCNTVDAGTCLSSADCPSGLCLTRPAGRVCVPSCNDSTPCPSGMECEMRHTGAGLMGYCVPTRRDWTP